LLSEAITGVLRSVAARLDDPINVRPVLLACADGGLAAVTPLAESALAPLAALQQLNGRLSLRRVTRLRRCCGHLTGAARPKHVDRRYGAWGSRRTLGGGVA
jgi:hypothetical protein